jgi:HK97 family phage portal protein
MAFVVSDGKLMGLNRPSLPRVSSIVLSATYSADYATIWRTQPHVRTVVGFLARNIAQIGIHAFERTSDTDRRRLTDHPLAALIAKPNARTTRYRLIDALVNDLGIFDVACWAKAKVDGDVAGLLRLPPQQIEPLGESWAWPEGVRFKGNRGSIELGPDEVVLFRGYNPTDARWGVSPMETLRQVLAEEYQATLYREQLWRNGARFPGHIERPAGREWSDAARERFRSDWRGLYTGNGPGAGGTPILEDDMKFVPGGITPAQAQYLETRKLTREEVAAAFHIPLPMVGILDHATFSNIEEQHKNLYQDTLGPWLEMIQQEIGLQLVPDFDSSGKVYVEFNLAEKMKGSFEEQATSLQTAVGAPWLTRNEARARQNLPQVDGGDELVTPLNVLVGGQASPTDSAPAPKRYVIRGEKGPELEVIPEGRRIKSRAPSTHESKYAEVVGAFFARQQQVVVSRLGAKAAEDWWDAERWDRELGADLYALALQTTKTVAADVMDSLGAKPGEYDVDRTLAFLAAVTKRVAGSVNKATKGQLDTALEADDPAAAVADVFDQAKTSRTAQIATTSITAMSGFATVEAAKQASGGTATKTWETGANPRPTHAAMNGETVGIEETFSNGLMWPGDGGEADEVAGCNCDVSITIP